MADEPTQFSLHRLKLQALLVGILGSKFVYHVEPSNTQMEYPCIRYKLDDAEVIHADDAPYHRRKRWQVTVIDPDPDSDIPDRVAAQPLTRMDRVYVAANLNHSVFTMFF